MDWDVLHNKHDRGATAQLGTVDVQNAGAAHRLVVLLFALQPRGKNVTTFEVRDSTVFL